MRVIRSAAVVVSTTAVVLLLADCSRGSPATPETTEACRTLVEDDDLAWFRENAGAPGKDRSVRAAIAVGSLGEYLPDPAVDPAVAEAMSHATVEVRRMNHDDATRAVPFDGKRFRDAIEPVVTACERAGVDMSVPQ